MSDKNKFYVYVYEDPDTKIPFYVGKGNGARAKSHLISVQRNHKKVSESKNMFKVYKIRKILDSGKEPIIKLIYCDDEESAFDLERLMIGMIGRRNIKTGPLCNLKEGGTGASLGSHIKPGSRKHCGRNMKGQNNPRYGVVLSEETKKNISEAKRRLISEPGYINKHIGMKRSEAFCKKISEDRKGIVRNEKLIKLKEIIEFFNTKPNVDFDYDMTCPKSGQWISYFSSFCRTYYHKFGYTSVNGLRQMLKTNIPSITLVKKIYDIEANFNV